MNIEQKIGKIILETRIGITVGEKIELIQALLSSPDIVVVEKPPMLSEIKGLREYQLGKKDGRKEVGDKLQKMERVVVGLLNDCKLNLEACGGCYHDVGICVCGVISLIADAEESLADLEG